MATTPEGKVKNAIRKLLASHGVYYFMPATHGYGRSGVADFVACVAGHFVAIEAKAGKGKMTALQEREAELVRSTGGVFLLVDDTPESMFHLDHTLLMLRASPTTHTHYE